MTNSWPKTRYKPQLVGISETHWAKSQCKKKVIRWCFIDPGLSCKITVQFCWFRIYCTCLLKQSWTAANVVAGSSFQSGEEREESWVINNMSSVLLLQWSSHFTLDLHSGFPCKFLDHCWCEEAAFWTNSKLFVTLPWTGNWKGNFSVRSDLISNGKTSW